MKYTGMVPLVARAWFVIIMRFTYIVLSIGGEGGGGGRDSFMCRYPRFQVCLWVQHESLLEEFVLKYISFRVL